MKLLFLALLAFMLIACSGGGSSDGPEMPDPPEMMPPVEPEPDSKPDPEPGNDSRNDILVSYHRDFKDFGYWTRYLPHDTDDIHAIRFETHGFTL